MATSLPQTPAFDPKRGEIWWVDLDPTEGDEIQKWRPCVIVSSDGFRGLQVRLVVPITEWQPKFTPLPYHTKIEADIINGLDKDSSANALQTRAVSPRRFDAQTGSIGTLTANQMEEVVISIAAVVEGNFS